MPTFESVQEIREHYGELKGKIMNRLFELPSEVAQVDVSMSPTIKERLGKEAQDQMRRAAQEERAANEIDAAKTKYVELELEEAEAIEALAEHASEVISPKSASVAEILQAATMTEDQLTSASEIARSLGDAGEDALLVLLRAAYERDMDGVMYHIAAMNPEWELALNAISEAAQSPDLDPEEIGQRFDSIVPQSAVQLLGASQSDRNFLGMIR